MLILHPGAALLTAAAMRAAEADAIAAGTPVLTLMERASEAAAAAILAMMPAGRALVLAGPGNNGGDGHGVALALRRAGLDVAVARDAPPVAEPAATMAARWDGPVLPLADAGPTPLIIDALFGIGLARPMPASVRSVLAGLAGQGRVAALDIVSGIDADTGVALGPVLPADLTIAFGAAKQGHVLNEGAGCTGRLVVADIGIAIPDSGVRSVRRPARLALARDTHKYARGSLMVIEGEARGAARLAARAALRAGAGLVTLVGDGMSVPLGEDALMARDDAGGDVLLGDARTRVAIAGPGLAASDRARAWLARLLGSDLALVLDAGALALLSPAELAAARARLVLTPHEGEFIRLFGIAPGADRIGAVRAAAARARAVVLLKGATTLIAAPDGRVLANVHAVPELATAGSGDVLAGIIGGMLASGVSPFEAAAAGAWLHGEAGRLGGPGLVADALVQQLPAALAGL